MAEQKESLVNRVKGNIEKVLPMKIGSFILFIFILYLIFIVCRVIIVNYRSNKDIENEAKKVAVLQDQIKLLEYEINYLQTNSYKEKEARAKLGYKAPGESMLSMPVDQQDDKMADSATVEAPVKVPNFTLWWDYFFEK